MRTKCRTCGRKLRPYERDRGTEWWGMTSGGPKTEEAAVLDLEAGGFTERLRITDRGEGRGRASAWREVVRLGDYGEGSFCGLRCGYRFAVAIVNDLDEVSSV